MVVEEVGKSAPAGTHAEYREAAVIATSSSVLGVSAFAGTTVQQISVEKFGGD
jgi:hypothetical protein